MHGYVASHVPLPGLRVDASVLENASDSIDAVHGFGFDLLHDFHRGLPFARSSVVHVVSIVVCELFLVESRHLQLAWHARGKPATGGYSRYNVIEDVDEQGHIWNSLQEVLKFGVESGRISKNSVCFRDPC